MGGRRVGQAMQATLEEQGLMTMRSRSASRSPLGAQGEACRQHREDLLDEALAESFPASDPPSMARSGGRDSGRAGRRKLG